MAKQSTVAKDEAQTGQELRERSWELINAAGLDFAPKYISLKDEFNKVAPIDGLIRTTRGYYRLAEDTRNGTRVLLHSYERDQLTGVEKDGKIVLDPEHATDVYGIAARESKRGPLFRYLIDRDIWNLTNIFQQDLNLHAEEMTIPSETKGMPDRRKIKLANGLVAFGIVETDEGKWKIRFYKNLRKNWDESAGFATTSSENKSMFNPFRYVRDKEGQIKEFDELQDALKFVRRYWKLESRNVFQGKKLQEERSLTSVEKTKNKFLSFLMRIQDQKIVRDWTRALTCGVVIGIISTAVSGTPLLGACLAAGGILGWGTIAKSLETTTAAFQRWLLKDSDEKKEQSRMLKEEIEHINDYLLDTEPNRKRFRKKLSEESYEHLRLLSLEESDIIHDDEIPAPPTNELRDYERLSSAAYRYFGAQFDSSNDNQDDGILVATYPNGLVSLIHIEKDTRAARHYVTYNKAFDAFESEEKYKHLDPELTHLPAPGEVHKITHRQGKDFRYTPMSCDEFMADLSHKIGKDAQEIKAFGLPIRKLFNCVACDGTIARPKDAIPVEQWRPTKGAIEEAKEAAAAAEAAGIKPEPI